MKYIKSTRAARLAAIGGFICIIAFILALVEYKYLGREKSIGFYGFILGIGFIFYGMIVESVGGSKNEEDKND